MSSLDAETLAVKDAIDFFTGRNVEMILDVGSGDGTSSIAFGNKGFMVLGFDDRADAVTIARDKSRAVQALIDFEVGNLDAMPFEGELFDAAYASLTFDRVSPRQMAMGIDELARRIRRGGSLFVLFHPHDPTKPAGESSQFRDNDLRRLFPDFHLMEFRSYPGGFRGLFFRR